MASYRPIDAAIERCAFGNRMPTRAEALVASIDSLKGKRLRQARAHMRRVQLRERMAQRATEVAYFNTCAAMRITCAMEHLFGSRPATRALVEAGYLDRQAHRSERHRRGGNLELAQLLDKHIGELRRCLRDYPKPGRDEHGLVDPRVDVVSPSRSKLSFAS